MQLSECNIFNLKKGFFSYHTMIAQLEPIQFLEAQVAQQKTLIEEQRQLIVELRSKVTYRDQQRREALDALRAAKLEAHKNKIDYEHMHSR